MSVLKPGSGPEAGEHEPGSPAWSWLSRPECPFLGIPRGAGQVPRMTYPSARSIRPERGELFLLSSILLRKPQLLSDLLFRGAVLPHARRICLPWLPWEE